MGTDNELLDKIQEMQDKASLDSKSKNVSEFKLKKKEVME